MAVARPETATKYLEERLLEQILGSVGVTDRGQDAEVYPAPVPRVQRRESLVIAASPRGEELCIR